MKRILFVVEVVDNPAIDWLPSDVWIKERLDNKNHKFIVRDYKPSKIEKKCMSCKVFQFADKITKYIQKNLP